MMRTIHVIICQHCNNSDVNAHAHLHTNNTTRTITILYASDQVYANQILKACN